MSNGQRSEPLHGACIFVVELLETGAGGPSIDSIFPLRCGLWEPRDHSENRIALVFELFTETRRHGTGR